MEINQKVYDRGLALFNELHGEHSGEEIVEALKDIAPDYVTMTIEWAFGEIFSRDGLDIKTRELAVIAACVALGDAKPQLKAHIEAAVNSGASKKEITEVIIQTALYAGFAKTTNALFVAKETFENLKL